MGAKALRTFRKVGIAFTGAGGFYLGWTLFRIRRLVVERQKEIDATWKEAISARKKAR